MKPVELKKGIYWVGAIDWDLRNFHGYLTPRGSTYNAYLIVDEKIVLVDAVKQTLADELRSPPLNKFFVPPLTYGPSAPATTKLL
jgi:flavorubredoxin